MKRQKLTVQYRADQIAGSMALSGLSLSEDMKAQVVSVISGSVSGEELRRELVRRHKVKK